MQDDKEHGPHGGTWIESKSGLVEVSVFETGVPPEFRLYFFDGERRPQPTGNHTATAETGRPGGNRQVFQFTAQDDFLRSTTDIPEPHEFNLRLTLTSDGQSHDYHTRFTEDAHGHDHHHNHSHAHGHGHDHGKGIFGWLRGTFAHSHDAADKVDDAMASHERGIWALKWSLIGLGLTAVIQVVIVVLSHSVSLLADTIHNFADAGTSLPLWVAFALARRGSSRRFTYGFGKVEDVAGVMIVLIIFFSACVAAWESVRKIIHPQPITHLWWVVAAAVVGFLGNEVVAVFRIKVGEEIGSAALIADGQHARVDGFTSLAVLIGVFGVWFGVPILDPIVGLGITIAILFIVKDAAWAVWIRLIDGIEPNILAEIEHAPTHVQGVKGVHRVPARWIGHRVYGDVEIAVDPAMSVSDADLLAEQVRLSLRKHVRLLGDATVSVRPAKS